MAAGRSILTMLTGAGPRHCGRFQFEGTWKLGSCLQGNPRPAGHPSTFRTGFPLRPDPVVMESLLCATV